MGIDEVVFKVRETDKLHKIESLLVLAEQDSTTITRIRLSI